MPAADVDDTAAEAVTRDLYTPTARERYRMEHEPTRADRAVSWVGWHLPELSGVGLPLAGAWLISPWCAVVSALTGTGWALNEARQRRHDRANARTRQQLPTVEDGDQGDEGGEQGDDGDNEHEQGREATA